MTIDEIKKQAHAKYFSSAATLDEVVGESIDLATKGLKEAQVEDGKTIQECQRVIKAQKGDIENLRNTCKEYEGERLKLIAANTANTDRLKKELDAQKKENVKLKQQLSKPKKK